MGYLLKTTFWLGLVLSAMPLGDPPKVSEILSPTQQAAACSAASAAILTKVGSAAEAYRGLAAMGCASFTTTSVVAPAPAATPGLTASLAPVRGLTAADRKPPWMGPAVPLLRPKTG